MKDRNEPYCDAQVGGMECGQPVDRWGHQCVKHDPRGITKRFVFVDNRLSVGCAK